MEPCYLSIFLCLVLMAASFIHFKVNIDNNFNRFYDQLKLELGRRSLRGIITLLTFIALTSFIIHKQFH